MQRMGRRGIVEKGSYFFFLVTNCDKKKKKKIDGAPAILGSFLGRQKKLQLRWSDLENGGFSFKPTPFHAN